MLDKKLISRPHSHMTLHSFLTQSHIIPLSHTRRWWGIFAKVDHAGEKDDKSRKKRKKKSLIICEVVIELKRRKERKKLRSNS